MHTCVPVSVSHAAEIAIKFSRTRMKTSAGQSVSQLHLSHQRTAVLLSYRCNGCMFLASNSSSNNKPLVRYRRHPQTVAAHNGAHQGALACPGHSCHTWTGEMCALLELPLVAHLASVRQAFKCVPCVWVRHGNMSCANMRGSFAPTFE